ncbi:hypothetical protein M427DRAFT_308064 [Gonapodya prolifera JEL478]|uniref:Fanconi-associated nuclease n=1 Tax=Gonapodya prolifera (strain JEL478) TaxID=1344416 RepID=A0A139AHX7_GONPJ|nr:hypothetical protein M427DRAFT_308064 [Gonapodya prolifera JEL478]|eukprot:KXS16035.1 hypothetical protein M427DRAFT_308064 [Gonapodya prolifera JEL478]
MNADSDEDFQPARPFNSSRTRKRFAPRVATESQATESRGKRRRSDTDQAEGSKTTANGEDSGGKAQRVSRSATKSDPTPRKPHPSPKSRVRPQENAKTPAISAEKEDPYDSDCFVVSMTRAIRKRENSWRLESKKHVEVISLDEVSHAPNLHEVAQDVMKRTVIRKFKRRVNLEEGLESLSPVSLKDLGVAESPTEEATQPEDFESPGTASLDLSEVVEHCDPPNGELDQVTVTGQSLDTEQGESIPSDNSGIGGIDTEVEEDSIQGWGNARLVSEAIETVLQTERDLLTPEEITFAATWQTLCVSSQALLLYLYLRKSPLRLSSSRYRLYVDQAVSELMDSGLLDSNAGVQEMSVKELLGILSKQELDEVARDVRVNASGTTKEALMCRILSTVTNQGTFVNCGGMWRMSDRHSAERKLRADVTKRIGPMLVPALFASSCLRTFLVLYFRPSSLPPPPDNLLTPAILHRSGRRVFPSVRSSRPPLWASRKDFDDWLVAVEAEREVGVVAEKGKSAVLEEVPKTLELVDTVASEANWSTALMALESEGKVEDFWRRKWSVAWVLGTLLNHKLLLLPLLPSFKSADEIPLLRTLLAQKSVRVCDRGRWYDRLALAEERYGDGKEAAYATCVEALAESPAWVGGGHRRAIEDRLLRLHRELNLPASEAPSIERKPLPTRTFYARKLASTSKFGNVHYHNAAGESVRVEGYALERYLNSGWDGGCLAETGLVRMVVC